jgi:uncharacterized membrane protein (UPF0127 family)
MIVINVTRNTLLSDRCQRATSFGTRLLGLLGRKTIMAGEGLLLDRCQAIHTCGMRFPIDVLSLDKELRVLRTIENLPSFRARFLKKAAYVLELPAGMVCRTRTAVGDQVQIRRDDITGA